MAAEEQGYGTVAKLLHWTMFLLLATQFVVGYAIDRADELFDGAVVRLFGGDDAVVLVHVLLGVTILALASMRLVWRRTVGLPPWAATLSSAERRIAHWVERTLYLMMFLIPSTGLALVFLSGEDWDIGSGEWNAPFELIDDDLLLGAHILTHIVFFVAFATHVGLVLKHQFVDRDRLLDRML